MATEPAAHLLVSHAHEDAAIARLLVTALQDSGFRVWASSAAPIVGQSLPDELRKALEDAAAVLVVWSERSVVSPGVEREAAFGREAGKLVMVRIDTAQVPTGYRELSLFDLSGWDGDPEDPRLRPVIDRLHNPVAGTPSGAERADDHVDLDEFSATVRAVRGELTGLVTPTAIAVALAARHPEYAGGLLASVRFTADGEVADIDEWLRRVRRLYVIEEVAASRHEVISGRLLLAGLSLLDPVLAASLEASGVRSRLLAELDVLPRRPDDSSSTDVGFATDLVGDSRPLRAADDVLGIEDDVRTLCRLVMARSTSPPLAVGLFGDWGTGKSFFLQRMRTRIVEMSDEAKTSAIGLGTCERVIQVTFNAWHYLDADLWASLANRLYQGIAGSPLAAEEFRRRMFEELASTKDVRVRAQREGRLATDELATAERALADRTQKLAELRNGRLTPTDAASVVGLAITAEPDIAAVQGTTVGELAADARFGHGLVRRVLRETSWLTKALAILAVLLTAGAAWALFSLGWAERVAAFVPPIVAAGVAWATGLRDAFRKVRAQAKDWQRFREEADARLRSEVEELRAQIAAAKVTQRQADETLTELRDGGLVRRYLVERAQSAAYRDRLGLVSLVREDLEALVQLLDPVSGDRLGSRIDRIVLYVDDLDRCPPARVVEVLQAVHLLLAFPLFVVVVAVDARWLITSLELHYRELLGHDSSGVTFADWELTPSNYLEKIFQIPFVLRPMSPDGYGRLVRRLAPVRAQEVERRVDLPADPEPDLAVAQGTTNSGAAAPEVREPTVLLQAPLPGTVLGLRFSADGQWLVAVTTEGVWRWERSRTDLLLEHGGGAVMAAISSGARVVVTFAADGWLCVLDMATGEVHREQLATERQPQELAAADTGAVVGATAAGQLVWLAGDAVGGAEVQNPKAHDLHLTGDGRSLVWREGRDGRDLRTATGDDSWALGPWADDTTLSPDGELLTLYDGRVSRHLRPEWEVDVAIARATRPIASTPHDQVPLPLDTDLSRLAARASGGWWLLERPLPDPSELSGHNPGLWHWPDDAAPEQLSFGLTGDRLAADHRTALVVSWGGGGFQVADSTGVRYEAPRALQVDLATVSPLGRLVATVGAGELRLWEVAGSGAPEQPSQLELELEEAGFLVDLAPLVDTPRMAKRLVNVYRLLRASAAGRVGLSDPTTGDYRVALVLLALVVAHPRLAEEVFVELGESVSPTWSELVTDLLAKPGVDLGPELEAERTAVLNGVLALSVDPTPSPIELFRSWGEHASRFHVAPR